MLVALPGSLLSWETSLSGHHTGELLWNESSRTMLHQASLQGVLEGSSRAVLEAKQCVELLPNRAKSLLAGLPQTFTEASQHVQAREDERRKREAKKEKAKLKGGLAFGDEPAGLAPGPPETSVFWLISEVRNGVAATLVICGALMGMKTCMLVCKCASGVLSGCDQGRC